MSKKEYIRAYEEWLDAKAKEKGVKPLTKGFYYNVISEGNNDGEHPNPAISLPHTTLGRL